MVLAGRLSLSGLCEQSPKFSLQMRTGDLGALELHVRLRINLLDERGEEMKR